MDKIREGEKKTFSKETKISWQSVSQLPSSQTSTDKLNIIFQKSVDELFPGKPLLPL